MASKGVLKTKTAASKKLRRTQAERRDTAERNLLNAAARLIAKRSPAQVTLAKIGEEAGYSRGIVNHHFGSKENLFKQLVHFVEEEFTQAFESAQSGDLAFDRITILISTFYALLENLTPIHRAFLAMWADSVVGSPQTREVMVVSDRGFRTAIAYTLEEGVKEGSIRNDIDTAAFSALIVGQFRGVALQMLIDPEAINIKSSLKEMQQMLNLSLKKNLTKRNKK